VNASTYEIVDLKIESDSQLARRVEDKNEQNEDTMENAEPKSETSDSQRQRRYRRGRGRQVALLTDDALNDNGQPIDAPNTHAHGKSTALA